MSISPLKSASVSFQANLLVVGTIVAENQGRVDIQIPRLSGAATIQNVEYVDSGFDAKPVKGEKVIVGFLEGVPDDPLVLGRISSSMAKKTVDRNETIKDLNDRIKTLETQIAALNARVTSLEQQI
jgi:hypothetical protein